MAQNIAFDVIARDKASATFSRISNSSNKTEGHLKKFGKTAALALGGVGIGTGLISFLKDSTAEAREAQKAGALTNQVIKTTGGAAHVTAKQVGDLATSISKKVGIDDEAIQSGENLLLTFKGIRNEAGKGNKIFNQATQAAVDLGAGLAAASGGQINFRSATTLVGKALNDPIKGLTALRRVGVAFTKGQQDQIKKLVESGHQMKAQKIILRELRSEFGGAAASQATSADKARVAWKNLEEQVGTALLPVIDNLANKVANDVVPAISKFVTQMQDGTGKGGELVDELKSLVSIGKGVFKLFTGLPGPVKKYGAELAIGVVVMSKVTAGMRTMGAMFTLTAAQIEAGTTRTQLAMMRLKGGMGMVAGAGGMLLMADSAGRAGTKLGLLEGAAGGALSGAALGAFSGPVGAGIGAAIGGLAGGAMALMHNTKNAGDSAKTAISKWQTYAATLDQVTGATTGATRAAALKAAQDSGLLKRTRSLGIADRLVVNALVNGGKARDAVVAASKRQIVATDAAIAAKKRELKAATEASTADITNKSKADAAHKSQVELDALKKLRIAQQKDVDKVLDGVSARRKAVLETQKNAAAANDLTGKLKGIPPNIRTKILNEGIMPTVKGITTLSEKYRLTPKQVKTVIAASGVPLTQKQIDHLVKTVNMYNLMHAAPKLDVNTKDASRKIAALIAGIASIKDKTVHITTSTNANVAEAVTPKHRASGGPVRAGTPYIVGEKRPELFVPSTNGTIVPKVPMSGGTQFVFSGDIYAQDVNDFLREVQKRSGLASLDGRRRAAR